MPRPYITRCVARLPGVTVFKPAGVPLSGLRRTVLHLDELEALWLVDGQGLEQAEAAESMKVSRATVGRILRGVRKKVALALAEGKALFIEQGAAPVEHRPTAPPRRRKSRPSRSLPQRPVKRRP